MADTKAQEPSRSPSTRWQESLPSREYSRDIFNPFSMLRRLSEEMDRAFGTSFGLGRAFGEGATWMPPIEVRERDNNIEICAELPGLNKEDVKVDVMPDGIMIEGEKKREKESEQGGIRTTERSYGHFARMVPLPEGAETDKVKAEFKNGVLQIRVPYPEERRKSRRIPIG